MSSSLVLKRGHNSFSSSINHVSGGRISRSPINAECNPARLISEPDACTLFRRHRGRIENVKAGVRSISEPQLLFVRRQSNAVARATVSFRRSFLVSRDFYTVKHLSGLEVSYFKPEQLVYINKTQCLTSVDRERTYHVAERADLLHNRMFLRICNRQ